MVETYMSDLIIGKLYYVARHKKLNRVIVMVDDQFGKHENVHGDEAVVYLGRPYFNSFDSNSRHYGWHMFLFKDKVVCWYLEQHDLIERWWSVKYE